MLLDPDWNIRLGVSEMAVLHSALGKNLPLTIAAFNAGIGRVKGWLEGTGEIDTDLFVERIPFRETQNYVRRVFTHYARYRFLENPNGYEGVEIPPTVGPVKRGSR
jgi:soluble lytic murein transglycosylase